MHRPAQLFAAVSLISGLACSAAPESPEAQIRSLISELEVAAEARELRDLKEAVSERYADDRGNDRRAVVQLLTYHFLRNQSIHLLSRIAELEVPEAGRAFVTVYVAMAGRPIPDATALVELHANFYRFDFALEWETERWLVTRADWRPARSDDFL